MSRYSCKPGRILNFLFRVFQEMLYGISTGFGSPQVPVAEILCNFSKDNTIRLFYTLWKKSRQKSTFLPYRVKKHHSTLEMDTLKIMLLLSYLASLDNKPRT